MKFTACYSPRTFGKSEAGRQKVRDFLKENPGSRAAILSVSPENGYKEIVISVPDNKGADYEIR